MSASSPLLVGLLSVLLGLSRHTLSERFPFALPNFRRLPIAHSPPMLVTWEGGGEEAVHPIYGRDSSSETSL